MYSIELLLQIYIRSTFVQYINIISLTDYMRLYKITIHRIVRGSSVRDKRYKIKLIISC